MQTTALPCPIECSKRCPTCDTDKLLSDFHRAANRSDGRHAVCKSCRSATRSKGIRLPDVSQDGLVLRVCSKCRLEKELQTSFYHASHGADGYSRRCKACTHDERKVRENKDPEKHLASQRKRNLAFREKVRGTGYYRKYQSTLSRVKRETRCPTVKVARILRTRIVDALRVYKRGSVHRSKRTEELLGCSFREFVQHIESLWLPGMTWENHGLWKVGEPMKWHVDHIRPIESFDLTNPEQQSVCFHWSNMQPLWAEENLKKGAKHA